MSRRFDLFLGGSLLCLLLWGAAYGVIHGGPAAAAPPPSSAVQPPTNVGTAVLGQPVTVTLSDLGPWYAGLVTDTPRLGRGAVTITVFPPDGPAQTLTLLRACADVPAPCWDPLLTH
jgi:hypothetical protein